METDRREAAPHARRIGVEDTDFSDEFCRFLQAQVPSVQAAEDLLKKYQGAQEIPAEVAPHLATLAAAYEQRPVTLFRIIYALRDQRIRSFADAFRLKDKP